MRYINLRFTYLLTYLLSSAHNLRHFHALCRNWLSQLHFHFSHQSITGYYL